MIDADHMATSHVNGSCRFGLVFDGGVNLHGVVPFPPSVHCKWHRKSVMCHV